MSVPCCNAAGLPMSAASLTLCTKGKAPRKGTLWSVAKFSAPFSRFRGQGPGHFVRLIAARQPKPNVQYQVPAQRKFRFAQNRIVKPKLSQVKESSIHSSKAHRKPDYRDAERQLMPVFEADMH